MQNINTLDTNSKLFVLFIIITFKSKVTNSGAARVTGGLAPSFFWQHGRKCLTNAHCTLFHDL